MSWSAWDSAGRPTRGTKSGDACVGDVVRSYDDVTRVVTSTECGTTTKTTHGADGLIEEVAFTGDLNATFKITILDRIEVCL